MSETNSLYQTRNRYLIIGLVAIIIFVSLAYSFYSSSRMIGKYSPLVDATMEIKLEATSAHLWFEELLAGDKNENFDDITKHLDHAKWYARAMLEGGKNPEGTYLPLSDLVPRGEVAATIDLINQFEALTHQRYQSASSAGIGSETDQQYDRVFKILIHQIDGVETLLQQKIRDDFSKLQIVQISLMLVIILLSMFGFFMQYRYDQAQKKNIHRAKEAKDRAIRNEMWLKTTMNSMGDGVIITDHIGNVTYLNPVASSLTGWRLKDAINKKMTEVFNIVNEETKKPVEDPVNMVIRKNVVVGLANHTELIAKDGTVWPISDSAAPIFDEENNLVGIVVVFHEVTAQKKAEAEKATLEGQLRQAFKMEAIGTLAGGIAHDFNNILAIIIGNADMALDGIPDESLAKHNVQQVLVAGNRAKDLVKQILSFSRRDKNIKELLPICGLVEESMKSLRSTIPSSVGLKINIPEKCRMKESDFLMILTDPIQFHQLLLNLCVNAVQAMDETGVLDVSVHEVVFGETLPADRAGLQPGIYAHLSVSDTGTGMIPEVIEMIFDPFFTTKEIDKGTGMGLSVVHGIVENHGGKIFVDSELGKGSTFHIYLPVIEGTSEKRAEENGPLPSGSERILFVDDEVMLAEMGKDIIQGFGYDVTAKSDSLQALELFKKNPGYYDLVITDQTMPNMTGAEFAKQLLLMKPDLPIILCTGYSSKVDKVKAKQIGVREFASKPLKRKDIATLIRAVLDTPRKGK
ncbi:MAG: ATP-binding protein [Desulforhopalus sp.]